MKSQTRQFKTAAFIILVSQTKLHPSQPSRRDRCK
jgi:hypothetical protein